MVTGRGGQLDKPRSIYTQGQKDKRYSPWIVTGHLLFEMLLGNRPKSSSNRRWTVNPSYKGVKARDFWWWPNIHGNNFFYLILLLTVRTSVWNGLATNFYLKSKTVIQLFCPCSCSCSSCSSCCSLLLLLLRSSCCSWSSSRRSLRAAGRVAGGAERGAARGTRKKKRRSSRRGAASRAGRAKQHKQAEYLFEKHCKPKWPGYWV